MLEVSSRAYLHCQAEIHRDVKLLLLVIAVALSATNYSLFGFLYNFPLPTASHITLVADLPLSITCRLFISDCWIYFTTEAGWIFRQFLPFPSIVCCYGPRCCGGSFLLLLFSIIVFVPNQFHSFVSGLGIRHFKLNTPYIVF